MAEIHGKPKDIELAQHTLQSNVVDERLGAPARHDTPSPIILMSLIIRRKGRP